MKLIVFLVILLHVICAVKCSQAPKIGVGGGGKPTGRRRNPSKPRQVPSMVQVGRYRIYKEVKGYQKAVQKCGTENARIATLDFVEDYSNYIKDNDKQKLVQTVIGKNRKFFFDFGVEPSSSNIYGEFCPALDHREWTITMVPCGQTHGLICDTHKAECQVPRGNLRLRSQEKKFYENSFAEFMCDPGFELHGEKLVKCGPNGAWEDNLPTCRAVRRTRCGQLTTSTNIIVDKTNDDYEGSEIVMRCKEGYLPQHEVKARCQSDGKWSNKAPECKLNACRNLPFVDNGYFDRTYSNYVGSKALFRCLDGYAVNGREMIECNATRHWTHEVPTCRKIVCPKFKELENGYIDRSNGNDLGSVATFNCHAGYRRYGPETAECRSDNTWSNDLPTCQLIWCPRLDAVKYSFTPAVQSSTVGTKVKYECHDHYELRGSPTITCGADGRWSANPPTCVESGCPAIQASADLRQQASNGLRIGSSVTFSCDEGVLDGSSRTYCQNDKRWSNAPPRCKSNKCQPLAQIENGQTIQRELTIGSVVEFTCNENYELIGGSRVTCLETLEWSHDSPRCSDKCEITAQYFSGCKRPIFGQEVQLECGGYYCNRNTRDDLEMKVISHALSATITPPGRHNFKMSVSYANRAWYQRLNFLTKKDSLGEYECLVQGKNTTFKLEPVDPNESRSITCEYGTELRYIGFVTPTYVVVDNEKMLLRNERVRVADRYRGKQFTIHVCFCEQTYFPVGCIEKHVQC